MTIYHAAVAADWTRRTDDAYEPSGFASEGFIHCSTGDQLHEVLHRLYSGRRDLIVLTIDESAVSRPLVWEDLYDAGQEYPHVYGPLDLAAVINAKPLTPDGDGRFDHWRPST